MNGNCLRSNATHFNFSPIVHVHDSISDVFDQVPSRFEIYACIFDDRVETFFDDWHCEHDDFTVPGHDEIDGGLNKFALDAVAVDNKIDDCGL